MTAGALVGIVALVGGAPTPSFVASSLLLNERIMTQCKVVFFCDQGNGDQGHDDGLYYGKSDSFKYDKPNDPDGPNCSCTTWSVSRHSCPILPNPLPCLELLLSTMMIHPQ